MHAASAVVRRLYHGHAGGTGALDDGGGESTDVLISLQLNIIGNVIIVRRPTAVELICRLLNRSNVRLCIASKSPLYFTGRIRCTLALLLLTLACAFCAIGTALMTDIAYLDNVTQCIWHLRGRRQRAAGGKIGSLDGGVRRLFADPQPAGLAGSDIAVAATAAAGYDLRHPPHSKLSDPLGDLAQIAGRVLTRTAMAGGRPDRHSGLWSTGGFGNAFSRLITLLERPIRSGTTFGTFSSLVSWIRPLAATITGFDHIEMIIPN